MSGILIACPNFSLDRTIEVDDAALGKVHRSTSADIRGGGKGVNVARALDNIGVQATVAGMLGGHTGEAVKGLLAAEGMDAKGTLVDGETRSCLTVVAPGSITVFNESGPTIDDDDWGRLEDVLAPLMESASVFICSGSFPPGTRTDAAARLVALASEARCYTICDTSREYLDAALEAEPDLVKPNLSEAAGLFSGTTDETVDEGPDALERAEEFAVAIRARGPAAVCVSAGAAGLALAREGSTVLFEAPKVGLVNSIGAGDSLVAGIAYELTMGGVLEEAVTRGMGMAGASCETLGAGDFDPLRAEEIRAAVVRRSGSC